MAKGRNKLWFKFKIGWVSIFKGVRARGPKQTFLMLIMALWDERLDRKWGFKASEFVDPADALPDHPKTPFANYYQPIRTVPFLKFLNSLKVPTQGRFIDIGSGQGKALMLAGYYGFKKCLGVEYLPGLCEDARKNIKEFQVNTPDVNYEIVNEDGSVFQFGKEDRFILYNDPFSNELFEASVDSILASLKEHPRKLMVVYKNNNKRPMPALDRLERELPRTEFNSWGNLFQVYSN